MRKRHRLGQRTVLFSLDLNGILVGDMLMFFDLTSEPAPYLVIVLDAARLQGPLMQFRECGFKFCTPGVQYAVTGALARRT